MQAVIEVINGVPRHPLYRMKEPVNFVLNVGEQIALVGPNGGGKSLLVDILMGRWPLLQNEVKYDFGSSLSKLVCDNIKYMAFRDSYGDADANYYYQQRWNSQDSEISPLVRDLLPESEDTEYRKDLFRLFGVESFLDRNVVMLSSGELRKFQLTKALLGHPKILILDNPFIGLDAETRKVLHDLLQRLIEVFDLQVMLVMPKSDFMPSFITHVVPVKDMTCGIKLTLEDYRERYKDFDGHGLSLEKKNAILDMPYREGICPYREVLDLNKVNIRYGECTILKDVNWRVHVGDKWALTGDNGSGKSTLLSLICADNPQSYTCDIALFGRKRGTGESIWDIKKRIGYVSPEMHRAYLKNISAIGIVASGLFDTVGLYRRPSPEQLKVCEWWMDIFGVLALKDRSFLQLSSGEQRLLLLVRAFVKDPDLLILDEPLHGLDKYNCQLVKEIIAAFCERDNKTMIMVTHYPEELPECITHSFHLKRDW